MSAAMPQAESRTAAPAHACWHDIRAGMGVRCQDGSIGRVVGLAPDWVDRPTHLLVQTGPLVSHEIALPLQWVAQVMPDQVVLHVRRRHLARVLPCVTDDQIQAEVREALHDAPTFRADDAFLMIDVAARGHVVTLGGHVRTLWRALLAETIARQVPGVWDVQNQLIGDDEVEDAVMQALQHERRLHPSALRVQSLFGQITLRGKLRTAEEATLALLLARRVPGVRTINNQLTVIEAFNSAPALPVDGHAPFAARGTGRAGLSQALGS